jgi:hypothetical protein
MSIVIDSGVQVQAVHVLAELYGMLVYMQMDSM